MVVDSITHLDAKAKGAVVVTGSHGGRYSGNVALAHAVRGGIFHDAGVGLDGAGIAALDVMQKHGVAAAAVLSSTALIGSSEEMIGSGRIGHLNDAAVALGCSAGMTVAEAARLMTAAPVPSPIALPLAESRTLIVGEPRVVWALDSASLVVESDAGTVVVTGSHGQLLGGDPATALRARALGAIFNDAGVAADAPGGRLLALEASGIPAACVAAMSARIGDGRSTYFDGTLSRINEPAIKAGARVGMAARDFVQLLLTFDLASNTEKAPS